MKTRFSPAVLGVSTERRTRRQVRESLESWPTGPGEAITALGMIGPAAKDAIPTLEKLTEHDDPQISERAKAALRQVRGR